jgi:beta-fructofuranosidase
MSICTTIKFSPQEETLSVNKERSTSDPNIRNCNEQGPFTLFYRTDYLGMEPKDKLESLRIRIISDADTLEVFANDWFALATMVYSPDIGAAGISAFAKGEQGSTVIEEVNIWEGLPSARRS